MSKPTNSQGVAMAAGIFLRSSTQLRTLPAPAATTRSILDYPAHGSAGVVAAPAELAWHREVAQWLWEVDERSQREADEWKRTARM